MPLTTLTLETRPAYALIRGVGGEQGFVGEASAGLRREDFLWPLVRGSAKITYAVEEIEAYTSQGPKLHLGLSRWFWDRRLQLAVGYQIQVSQFLRISDAVDEMSAEQVGLQSPYRLAMLEQSVTYDRRDNPITPRRGIYADLRFEESASYWGSEFSYASLSPDLRGYLPLGGRATIAARTRLGVVLSGDNLPITQRYFGGGATSQRGFAQRRLSPVASALGKTVGIGGSALWESSLELRIDMMRLMERWLAVAIFADAGDVRQEFSELDPGHPHVAVGGGIRYHTPVGPLRFDLGYRVNRTGPEEPDPSARWAFHFTLGEAF
jgi:translocation and assembly module TamA